jgi:hypothetical protein
MTSLLPSVKVGFSDSLTKDWQANIELRAIGIKNIVKFA